MSANSTRPKRHKRSVLLLSLLVAGMFGFGFALVPLYGLICDVAGIQRAAPPTAASTLAESSNGRPVWVKFDSTVQRDLPWRFAPSVRSLQVTTGKLHEVTFEVHNYSSRPTTGQAIPAVVPWQATAYFNKTECFCFRTQRLEPGETRKMKLLFMVSPDLPRPIDSLTLSYSFMRVAGDTPGEVQ